VRETFFYVVPSTSARVVSHQLQDKVLLFVELKNLVGKLKANAFDASSLVDVNVATILGLAAFPSQVGVSSEITLPTERVELESSLKEDESAS
jgi:hypothetical protein